MSQHARRPGRPRGGPAAVNAPTEKATRFWPSARRLLGYLAPHRVSLAVVLLSTAASVVLTAYGPWLLGRATDEIFAGVLGTQLAGYPDREWAVQHLRAQHEDRLADIVAASHMVPGRGIDRERLAGLLGETLLVYLLAGLLSWVGIRVTLSVVMQVTRRLRGQVEETLHRVTLPYVDSQPRGEILSRATNDLDNVQSSLQQTLTQLLSALLTLVAVLVMMLRLSWLLTLIALVTLPLAAVLTVVIAQRGQRMFKAQWAATGELNGQIEEALTGHELVRAFGRGDEVTRQMVATNERLYHASFGASVTSGIIMPAMSFVGNIGYVLVAVAGGLRVASGSMTIGAVQAFIQYSREFTQPVTQVASLSNLVQSGVASAERVFELLDAPQETPDRVDEPAAAPSPARAPGDRHRLSDPDDPTVVLPRPGVLEAVLGLTPPPAAAPATARRSPRAGTGRVRFEDVSFAYTPDRPLIEHLDLTVEPGHTVAIVGPTGAGKTTLVNLILRFYEVEAGRITLDGVDIRDLSRSALRARTGMVLQDTWLFNGTIRDNIAYGKAGATDADIRAAARATFVDRFVQTLPDGYDTVLDEDASNVSAGEKQLITIARAFISDPDLLILDEATSSVDTRTEALVQRAMAALRADRTSFVIAHRLSTIRDADSIVMMADGRIVEQGRHQDLIVRRGPYAELYAAQFSAPLDEPAAEPLDEPAAEPLDEPASRRSRRAGADPRDSGAAGTTRAPAARRRAT